MGIETPAQGGYEPIAFGHSAGCDPLYTGWAASTAVASSGTLTLTVKGKTFVEGKYSCSSSGCAFTGTMAGKRVAAVTTPGLSGVGQATSSVSSTREAWLSAVSDWANTHFSSDQVASIVSAAASVKMTETLNEQGRGSGHSGESGGNGGAGGGGGMGDAGDGY
jgi:hypothetical protein